MFVAYLVPKEDYHLVVEDGLGYVEIGATKEEAEAKVRKTYEDGEREANERWLAAGYPPIEGEHAGMLLPLEDHYVLHTTEV